MPRVHFVHENVTVEVDKGRRLSDIAKERGIAVCRQTLGWTGIGDYTVWVDGAPGATSSPTFWERLKGVKGWRRLANHTRIEGDVRVWTQQGIGSRLGGTRNIDDIPNPTEDSSLVRSEHGAAGTAWCPLGHPSAVGKGDREPPKFEEKAKKGAAAKAGAAKAGAAKGGKAAGAKPAAKKAEAKAEDKKADAKAEDKKADAKAEDKKADAKAEDKKADAKAEDEKAEAKAEDEKADAKAEDEKAEAKAEDEKADAKPEDEKADAKKAEADKIDGEAE
jgi:hypothetical protein